MATATSRTSQGQGRLSARRGSVSAPDPLGKHANVNDDPNRSTCSKLTIVRVVDPAQALSSSVPEPPSSPGLHHRRSSRRHGSSFSQSGNDSRLSFAISSFAPTSPTQTHPPSPSYTAQNHSTRTGSSPSSSPRLRPSSPSGFTRRHSTSSSPAYSRPHLSPEQLVELARQSRNPRFVPQVSNSATSPASLTSSTTSPTFTPLAPDVYLPFIDRPSEVTALLSTPPTAKLFSLLAQTFPQRGSETEDREEDVFTADPSSWTFELLRAWLTTVDRVAANDSLWVRNTRKCILAHSELIWERLKGALGVPPELELEEDEHNQPCEGATSLSRSEMESAKDEIDVSDPLASPRTGLPSENVVIKPIFATSSSTAVALSTPSHPPPLSLGASLAQSTSMIPGDGLQDIGEEGEEEDNGDDSTPQGDSKTVEPETQIHGLRISTDPVPSSPARASFGLSLPSSPTIGSPVSGGNIMELELPTPPLRCRSRTDSRGSVSNCVRPTSRSSASRDFAYHSSTSDLGDFESERAYDPVGDRVPGNPLFPSNFARLALGPTLRANNPSLRSSHTAPTLPRFARWTPGGRPPSWIEGWDSVKHEYAATVASGSSVGVGGGE
ncbi:hypothetical protein EDD15DRAFT_2254154 [Pisolithus albus]|nr:hypothetical protein EDD15DRAFT_2254154 [Pisolithus albus]